MLLLIGQLDGYCSSSVVWHDGVIVLKDAQVMPGKITTPDNDLVLYDNGEEIKVYAAHQLKELYYYDNDQDINRRFVSIKESGVSYSMFALYEVVVAGSINVLRKPRIHTPTQGLHDGIDYNYYVQSNNELVSMKQFRERIYPAILQADKAALLKFMKRGKLNPNVIADVIPIIQFYNRHSEHVSLARH